MEYAWPGIRYRPLIVEWGALRIETDVEAGEARRRLAGWAPWRVLVELSNGVTTADLDHEFPFTESPLWKLGQFAGKVPLEMLRDVLDVGCNVGYNAIHLARAYGARCVGIDVQQRHIDAASYLAKLAEVDCRFELAHAENVTRADGFELVVHFGTLYHLPNPLNGLRAAWENLRPGGGLCLETQTYDDPDDERRGAGLFPQRKVAMTSWRSWADPLLTQTLPGHLGIEQRRRGVEVGATEVAEEVDHDRLEVLLADAWHCLLLGVRSWSGRKEKLAKEVRERLRRGAPVQVLAATTTASPAVRGPRTQDRSSVSQAQRDCTSREGSAAPCGTASADLEGNVS
jgi:SAM-dependent methyltransferase